MKIKKNIQFAILKEDDKGISFVMDSKTGRAKQFKNKELAKQYAQRHFIDMYQFVQVSEQDYNKFRTFWMADTLTL